MAWLHALHVRSSIARGRLWQAEYMLNGLRQHVLALACLRAGLTPHQGRGIDDLPPETLHALIGCLIRSLTPSELKRAFCSTGRALLTEIELADPALRKCLEGPLTILVDSDAWA
jgi:hypothetical protein